MGMVMMGLVNVHWASQIGVLNPKRESERKKDMTPMLPPA